MCAAMPTATRPFYGDFGKEGPFNHDVPALAAGVPHALRFAVEWFDPTVGVHPIMIGVGDGVLNWIAYNHSQLEALGFPAWITIVE